MAGRCLTCTNCTMVCPTCYCFDVHDELEPGELRGHRAEQRAERPARGLVEVLELDAEGEVGAPVVPVGGLVHPLAVAVSLANGPYPRASAIDRPLAAVPKRPHHRRPRSVDPSVDPADESDHGRVRVRVVAIEISAERVTARAEQLGLVVHTGLIGRTAVHPSGGEVVEQRAPFEVGSCRVRAGVPHDP